MITSRELAFDTLYKIYKDESFSNISVAGALKNSHLQNADKAFFTTLVYGVTERRITLDYNLSAYLNKPLKKLKPEVLIILRIGAYQILFMDKIPDSAAINESVKLTKRHGLSFASGLVNAVLRKVSTNGLKLPDESDTMYYSVKYSCPEYLVKLWIDAYGEDNAVGIMEHALGAQPIAVRVNTLKTDADTLKVKLESENIHVEYSNVLKDALMLRGAGSIEDLQEYKDGLFHVQDVSSQLCCQKLGAVPGDTVFDVCAAPGGKSFTLAQYMENKGAIKAFDLYEHRIGLINSGAKRLDIDIIDAKVSDAGVYDENLGVADKVLCDVPCAGLGVIGRKPEIRYKTLENIDNLPALQYHILNTASKYLRLSGRLVYSTCSLNPKENEAVVERFVNEHRGFKTVSMETVMPHINNCDGFFIAVIERTE